MAVSSLSTSGVTGRSPSGLTDSFVARSAVGNRLDPALRSAPRLTATTAMAGQRAAAASSHVRKKHPYPFLVHVAGIERAAIPLDHAGMLLVKRIKHCLQELHKAAYTANVLGRAAPGAIDEGRIFHNRIAVANPFDDHIVPPIVAEVVDVEEAPEAAADQGLEIARSLVRQTRYDEGLALYEELLAEDPGNDLAHLDRGRAFQASGRYEHAVDSFKSALAVVRHPDTEPQLHALIGEALRKQRRFHVAAAHLDKALALNANHIPTLIARSDLEADRRRAIAAGEWSEPQGPVAGGAATGRRGTDAWLAAARKGCRTVIARKPELALVRVLLGTVLLRMDEYETAAKALKQAFALAPSRPVEREAHRVLGEVREKQGRVDEAAAHYESALDIYPFDAEALERPARLHVREKRYRAALPLHRQLVKVAPFVAETHLELGMILYQMARHSDASRAVERALELAPGLETGRTDARSGNVSSPTPQSDAGSGSRR